MVRDLDIVIPHHDPNRCILRAIRSVIDPSQGNTRAIVVCHNLDGEADRLKAELGSDADSVLFLELSNGLREPGGPFNLGIRSATATYVGVLGSDDYYAEGALAGLVDIAEKDGADAVLARLAFDDGRELATPRRRIGRTSNLDYVKDRLAYRTAPLGIWRRSTVECLGISMTEGLRSGVDIAFSTVLFTSGKISFGAATAPYVIGTDAPSRVTTAPRPVAVELEALDRLSSDPALGKLSRDQLRALAVKVIRIHLMGAADRRRSEDWNADDARALARMLSTWTEIGGGKDAVYRAFNRADVPLLQAIETADPARIVSAAHARIAAPTWDKVLTSHPLRNADRESTLRAILAEKINERLPR